MARSDYSDDQRLSPDIIKNVSEAYRKLRNSIRWMLGTLAHFRHEDRVAADAMPELERLMLHRLAELDGTVRAAYAAYDYKKVVSGALRLHEHGPVGVLLRHPQGRALLRAALVPEAQGIPHAVDMICDAVLRWLAPILAYNRRRGLGGVPPLGGRLRPSADLPEAWRPIATTRGGEMGQDPRRAVRGHGCAGGSARRQGDRLLAGAAPSCICTIRSWRPALAGVDLAEVAITSAIAVTDAPAPADAFALDGVKGVAVVFAKASGRKCARSWRYAADVGSDAEWPDVSARDAQALRELRAAGRI